MKLLSSKIFAGYLLVIILLTGLILFFSHQTTRTHYFDTFEEELENLNFAIHDKVLVYFQQNKFDSLEEYVNKLGNQINTRITIIDTSGIVLADSKRDASTMENHKQRPEIQSALIGETGNSIRYSTTMKGEMLYVAMPITDKTGEILCISRISLFLSDINQLNTQLSFEILQIALVVVVISLLGVLLFTRSVTSPLKQLSLASRKVSFGDFDVKVFLKGRDEIQELAKNFNYMTEKLKEFFEQVNSQKEEYHILISSIQEGLIVLDKFNKIMLFNAAFEKMCKIKPEKDQNYWQIIRNNEFRDIVDEVKNKKSNLSKEIELFDNFFICSANYIESKEEIVILFYNITEIKKLEKVKRDFVVNVSHELKTPLTAIKGFAETLEDEIDEKNLHYLEIIMRHTDRLIHIVHDLLILSELEHENFELMFSNIHIDKVIENVMKMFEPKVKEKGIDLIFEKEDDIPKLRLDVYRIEQVFVNLVDNAFKYTDEGFIKIKLYQKENNVIVEISDTGVGIKKEDQHRIFERFYIVDKSRSRKVGGTGLGLSIVKHIVLNHGGDINIDSSYGNGTKFIITLPIIVKG